MSVVQAFAAIGWVLVAQTLNHKDYDGTTRRVRAYIIALQLERCNMTAAEARECIKNMFLACRNDSSNTKENLKSLGFP